MKLTVLFVLAAFSTQVFGQTVNIADPNLKNALLHTNCVFSDVEFTTLVGDADTNNNGEIEVSEAIVVQYLKISGQNIVSLSSISNFTNLRSLDCSANQLQTLDVSMLTGLRQVNCAGNQLTNLTLNTIPAGDFAEVTCSNNQLTSLDLPSANYEWLYADHNALSSISFAPTALIYESTFAFNQLTHFDVPQDVTFGYLNLSDNPLAGFSLQGEHAFEYLTLSNTLLTNIDLGNLTGCNYLTITDNPDLLSINLVNSNFEGSEHSFVTISGNTQLDHVCVNDFASTPEGPMLIEISEMERVSQALADGSQNASVTYYCSFTPEGSYNTISGNIKYDCNGPATVLENVRLSIADATGSGDTYSNSTGAFKFYTGSGAYTVTALPEHPEYFLSDPGIYSHEFTGANETDNVAFCISPNGAHHDLAVSITPVTAARPGFDATYKIIYENRGTASQAGTITLDYNNAATDLVFASPPLSGQTPTSMSWIFSGLEPFETGQILVRINVNSPTEIPAVHIGDVLNFTASIASDADETPADNVFEMDQTVVGSFDPNDKFVSKTEIGPSDIGAYLYYTVRFQNTGTAAAENVALRDKLSDLLDLTTLQMVTASHPYRSTLTGNKLEFFFEGIQLAASTVNEPASHGYVTYRIKPKSNIHAGDQIANTADIFFDFNSPIRTNTVMTTVSMLAAEQFPSIEFGLYPNPANESVTIKLAQNSSITSIEIYNVLGQMVKAFSSDDNSITLDISDINAGTYFVKVRTDRGSASRKMIKL